VAKKEKVPKNSEVKEKKKRNLKRNRARGNAYECKIAKELRELGYPGIVTSRSESKAMDNAKVDLIDTENKLPINCQIKATIKYPNYLEIKKACPLKDKPFVLF
jgi:Holliday junction resolvase